MRILHQHGQTDNCPRANWRLVATCVALALIGGAVAALAQTSGTVAATGASAGPGNTANISVTLSLTDGVTIDSLSFGVEIIANGGAPALQSPLIFTPDSLLPAPSFIDTGGGNNAIAVFWASGLALSSAVPIGTVAVTIPATASAGQTYMITITGASATSGGTTNIDLSGGTNATLTVSGKKSRGQITSQ